MSRHEADMAFRSAEMIEISTWLLTILLRMTAVDPQIDKQVKDKITKKHRGK